MAAKQDPRDFLDDAARLLGAAGMGTLSTVAGGQPHAALVTPALAADGAPVLLLSSLAVHTQQLIKNPACALLLVDLAIGNNPQTTPRLCLSGNAAVTLAPEARTRYLIRHPYAALYAGFADFTFWRIEVAQAYYIGGFAAAARLDPAALQRKIIDSMTGYG